MTIKDLFVECGKMINSGYGDKEVYISRDDEGNGFHKLIYGFMIEPDKIAATLDMCGSDLWEGDTEKNVTLLG